jgi:hypothetical protein
MPKTAAQKSGRKDRNKQRADLDIQSAIPVEVVIKRKLSFFQ